MEDSETKKKVRVARVDDISGNPHNISVGMIMPDTTDEVCDMYLECDYLGNHSERYVAFQMTNGNRQLWNCSRLEMFEVVG